MKRLMLLTLLAVSLSTVCGAREKAPRPADDEIRAEAEQGFGEILELWHNKQYGELYEKTQSGNRQSKEGFVERMNSAPLRPACCWQQKQDVVVTVTGRDRVTVRAKVGLEGAGDIAYRTRDFKLRKESGAWRISRADILSLAEVSKKRGHRRKKIYYRH
jgi:hypothetical protein